jgi:hypothetical protein
VSSVGIVSVPVSSLGMSLVSVVVQGCSSDSLLALSSSRYVGSSSMVVVGMSLSAVSVGVSVQSVEVSVASSELELPTVSVVPEADEEDSAGGTSVAVMNDVPMTLTGGTAPLDEGEGARLAGVSGVVAVAVAGTVVVPMTLIGGMAPVEEDAAAEVEAEAAPVSVAAPVAGIVPTPITFTTGVTLLPALLLLPVAGVPVWVASTTPVPITLT